jgi:hypothetical protein
LKSQYQKDTRAKVSLYGDTSFLAVVPKGDPGPHKDDWIGYSVEKRVINLLMQSQVYKAADEKFAHASSLSERIRS